MSASPISIVFAGTSAFAVPCLQALLGDDRFRVDLVITQPDKPVGRSQQLTAPHVKVAAVEAGLPVFQPESLNAQRGKIDARPDFLVVVAYGQILSEGVLNIPTRAPVNVHASLLPKYRGASPIHHAILNGDKETGVSIQHMIKQLDAGPVYATQSISIDPRETTRSLHDKLAAIAPPLLIQTLIDLPAPVAQDEAKAIICGKLKREDGIVDPSAMTATHIDTLVRALVPWPGVTWNDTKLLETSLTAHPDAMPVQCANGTTLYVIRLHPAGRKPMTGAEFARGKRHDTLSS